MDSITTHTYTMNRWGEKYYTEYCTGTYSTPCKTALLYPLLFKKKKNENLYTEKKITEIKSKQLKSG